MKIEYSYGGVQTAIRECVIAIGFFDGVHIAHRELISSAKEEAERLGLPIGVFTFSDSTDIKKTGRLYSDNEKEELISSLGVDFTVFADFPSLKGLTKDEFIDNVLIRDLNCQVAVVGYNFRFGRGALGNAEYLKCRMSEKGKGCIIKDEITSSGIPISTSYIKELISEGKINKANLLLGTPYHFTASVERGDGRGHTLGFPTVNSDIGSKSEVVKRGVYRSAVLVRGKVYPAVTNVGTCPTFPERATHAESFLIDCDAELYGEKIKVYLLEYLRDERKFSDAESLKMQINIDKNTVIKKNEEEKWQELGQS
jgi:riboflavin kinase/FMN adenylyltransferase